MVVHKHIIQYSVPMEQKTNHYSEILLTANWIREEFFYEMETPKVLRANQIYNRDFENGYLAKNLLNFSTLPPLSP